MFRFLFTLALFFSFLGTVSSDVIAQALTNPAVQSYQINDAALRALEARIKYSVAVGGVFYLSGDSCGNSPETINTRFVVSQSGRKFRVTIPSGLVLRGKGGRKGFKVKAIEYFDNGLTVAHELKAGAVKRGRARFNLTFTARIPTGQQCSTSYDGVLTVGVL